MLTLLAAIRIAGMIGEGAAGRVASPVTLDYLPIALGLGAALGISISSIKHSQHPLTMLEPSTVHLRTFPHA